MPTQCNTKPLEFEPHGRRRVVADFDGGPITSDAGTLCCAGWTGTCPFLTK